MIDALAMYFCKSSRMVHNGNGKVCLYRRTTSQKLVRHGRGCRRWFHSGPRGMVLKRFLGPLQLLQVQLQRLDQM